MPRVPEAASAAGIAVHRTGPGDDFRTTCRRSKCRRLGQAIHGGHSIRGELRFARRTLEALRFVDRQKKEIPMHSHSARTYRWKRTWSVGTGKGAFTSRPHTCTYVCSNNNTIEINVGGRWWLVNRRSRQSKSAERKSDLRGWRRWWCRFDCPKIILHLLYVLEWPGGWRWRVVCFVWSVRQRERGRKRRDNNRGAGISLPEFTCFSGYLVLIFC